MKNSSLPRLRNFLCMFPGCGKSFTDNAHLRDHTFVHTGEKHVSCEQCGKMFARASNLHDHMRVHSHERPYHCSSEGCTNQYSSRSALRYHVMSAHGSDVKIHACSVCRKIFRLPELLNAHLKTHGTRHTIECNICGKVYMSKSSFQRHQLKHNFEMGERQTIPQCERNELEETREKLYEKEKELATLQKRIELFETQQEKRKVSCDGVASRSTGRERFLMAETVSERFLKVGNKPYQCQVCQQTFRNFHQLRFHQKKHPSATISKIIGSQRPIGPGPKCCPVENCEYGVLHGKTLANVKTVRRHWQRLHQMENTTTER